MNIHFRQALAYPFRGENRKAMIWLPGAFFVALFLFGLIFGIFIALLGGDPSDMTHQGNFSSPLVTLVSLLYQLAQLVLNLLTSVLALGYCWWLMDRLQQRGLDTPGPDWFEDLPQLLLDGLKAFLYYIVVSIILAIPIVLFILLLVILFIVVLGVGFHENQSMAGIVGIFLLFMLGLLVWLVGSVLLGPFLFAPMICSARSRDLGELFNLNKAWGFAARHYRQSVTSMLYIVLLFLLYGIGMVALLVGTLGLGLLAWPFLMFAPYISMVHLAVQGLPCEPALTALSTAETGPNPTHPA